MIDILKHEGLINKLAWRTSRASGVEFEETQAKAREIAIVSSAKFDPTKSAPATFLWHCVHNGLLDWVKRQCRADRHESLEDLPHEPSTEMTPDLALALHDDVAALGREAREVCRIVLDCPAEACLTGDATRIQARRALRRHLRSRGWSTRTIERVFSEIGELLRQRA